MVMINENNYMISDYHFNLSILNKKTPETVTYPGEDKVFNVNSSI